MHIFKQRTKVHNLTFCIVRGAGHRLNLQRFTGLPLSFKGAGYYYTLKAKSVYRGFISILLQTKLLYTKSYNITCKLKRLIDADAFNVRLIALRAVVYSARGCIRVKSF